MPCHGRLLVVTHRHANGLRTCWPVNQEAKASFRLEKLCGVEALTVLLTWKHQGTVFLGVVLVKADNSGKTRRALQRSLGTAVCQ